MKRPSKNTALTPRTPDTSGHIQSVTVKDFKSLKEVDVELGQISVFVGANGSGKSCLLEAIGILSACAAGVVDDQALLRRGVRPGVPDLYKSGFAKQKQAKTIELAVTSHNSVRYRAGLASPEDGTAAPWAFDREALWFKRKQVASRAGLVDDKRRGMWVFSHTRSVNGVVRASKTTAPAVRTFLSYLDDFAIFAPVTPVLRGIAPDTAPRSPVGLYGGQLAEAVGLLATQEAGKAAIEQALSLIDWAAAVRAGEPSRTFLSPSVPTSRYVVEFQDRYMAKRRNILSGYDASEGALYILFMLVLASHAQSPAVFAVDNFDQALNPRTARALTRMFVENVLHSGRQVLLTTHNPLVLDGLDLGDERVRLFAVSRDRIGHTRVKRIPVKDFDALKKKHGEHAVSRLWIEGRLGGMPDNV